MKYANKDEYVRYKLQRNIKLGFFESPTCDNPDHDGQASVGSFVIREEGFTEYEAVCQKCVDDHRESLGQFFDRVAAGESDPEEDGFQCEDCEQQFPSLVVHSDGSAEGGLYIHRDWEDRSETWCCATCYDKRYQRDKAMAEEEQKYQEQHQGYFDDE